MVPPKVLLADEDACEVTEKLNAANQANERFVSFTSKGQHVSVHTKAVQSLHEIGGL